MSNAAALASLSLSKAERVEIASTAARFVLEQAPRNVPGVTKYSAAKARTFAALKDSPLAEEVKERVAKAQETEGGCDCGEQFANVLKQLCGSAVEAAYQALKAIIGLGTEQLGAIGVPINKAAVALLGEAFEHLADKVGVEPPEPEEEAEAQDQGTPVTPPRKPAPGKSKRLPRGFKVERNRTGKANRKASKGQG